MSSYQDILNKQVQVPRSVYLYKDSDGNGRGRLVSGLFTCNHINPGHAAPIHIRTSNGDLGWIKCHPTGKITLARPPQYIRAADELIASV